MSIHLGFVSEGADLRLTCAVWAFLSIKNRPTAAAAGGCMYKLALPLTGLVNLERVIYV